jgi:hypothetical protein
MSERNQRLLEPEWLPTSLWAASDAVLRLPSKIIVAYQAKLDQAGLMDLAGQRDEKNPPVGGLTQEQTDLHFAQQFDGSVARAELVLLDPSGELGPSSDMLIKSLSGGKLVLVDIPCGAGAISCSFLSNVAQLREEGILPRIPLHVKIVAGELSDPARRYAREMIEQLKPSLQRQAIRVELMMRSWDALDPISTSDLVREILRCQDGTKGLLVAIANFSSFLQRDSKFDEAKPQLEELMRYCSGGKGTALWIEPANNLATSDGGLFSRILRRITSKLKEWILHSTGTDFDTHYQSHCRYFRALAEEERVRTSVALMPTTLKGRE